MKQSQSSSHDQSSHADAVPPHIARALDDTLLWLCAMASPIGEERALCDAVEARLRAALPQRPKRVLDSLVAHVPGAHQEASAPKRPHVALVGHLDTVRTENGPARIDDDRCHGAGAADMKSGLAVMLVLVDALVSNPPPCDVTLVFYSREEGPYAENELGPVLEACPELGELDLAVCLEPSDNKLSLGCNGSLHATVTFVGRTAHSARPWEGESAVDLAVPVLAAIAARAPRESLLDGLVYRTVTTITKANDGGRGRNVVPDRFVLNINHRFSPDTSIAQAEAEVLELVGSRAQVEFTDRSPGALPSASHALVQRIVAAGARAVESKQAWTDVARFAVHGVPAVNFGPGENAQAHQRNESTSLTLVHEGYAIFERWLRSLTPLA